ncbi:hypothetical protein CFOL_v3_02011, partial [Cephalotus follicularis]
INYGLHNHFFIFFSSHGITQHLLFSLHHQGKLQHRIIPHKIKNSWSLSHFLFIKLAMLYHFFKKKTHISRPQLSKPTCLLQTHGHHIIASSYKAKSQHQVASTAALVIVS